MVLAANHHHDPLFCFWDEADNFIGLSEVGKLEAGDIFYAALGTKHVAHPVGQARILVVEREGSV